MVLNYSYITINWNILKLLLLLEFLENFSDLKVFYVCAQLEMGIPMQCTTITIITVIIENLFSTFYMEIIKRAVKQNNVQKTLSYIIPPLNCHNINDFFC